MSTALHRRLSRGRLALVATATACSLVSALWVGGCASEGQRPAKAAGDAPVAPAGAQGASGASAGPARSGPPAEDTSTPTAPPPVKVVDYQPTAPEFTVRAPNGLRVNRCVPKQLRGNTIALRTSDGVPLSALVLGKGERAVVLSHEQGYNICSWLSLGQDLAERGYQVLVPEFRNHGASGRSKDNDHLDRDVMAGIRELARRGAKRFVLGGASCGGTSSIAAAPQTRGFAGLIVMSSPRQCGPLNGVKVVASVRQPSFFAYSPGDMTFDVEVRGLYEASGAQDKHLEVVEGGVHGTGMLRLPDNGPGLRAKLLAFVDRAFGATT